MGNFMFIILHVMAILFGFVFLFITIPSHLIYIAIKNKSPPKNNRQETTQCPYCGETINAGAKLCRFCSKDVR